MELYKTLKKWYSKSPILVSIGLILTAIAIIVPLIQFIKMIWDAYNTFHTFDTGTQIIVMTVVSFLLNLALILIVTAYLSFKIGSIKESKK
jgi:hypothetical protein